MELITKAGKVKNIASAWGDSLGRWSPEGHHHILSRLLAEQPQTEAEVTAIIGNNSWTRLICRECKQEVEQVVQLGEEPDYESATTEVCLPCLKQALALVEGAIEGK